MHSLSKSQFERLANILDNLGQVSVAGVVIPTVGNFKNQSTDGGVVLVLGIIISMMCWGVSLKLESLYE